MLQVIRCVVCGESHIQFDATHVTVTFTKTSLACEHCNASDEEKHSEFICSLKCFDKYVQTKANSTRQPTPETKG